MPLVSIETTGMALKSKPEKAAKLGLEFLNELVMCLFSK